MNTVQEDKASLRKVTVGQLHVGMFIEEVLDQRGVVLVAGSYLIRKEEQIEYLKRRGIEYVYIDINKGNGDKVTETVEVQEPLEQKVDEPLHYLKEFENAEKIHKKAIECTRNLLESVKAGSSFSTREVRHSVEDIVTNVVSSPDASIGQCQMVKNDDYLYTHPVNVSVLMSSLAHSLGYSSERLVDIGMGGLLHDIGKMRIPERIINKPGKLSQTEYALIRKHTLFGMDIIKGKRGICDITQKIVVQHHERYNGSGYPFGIQGKRLHYAGLMGAVADVYDALTSDKIYQNSITPQKALALIFKGCDNEFSREIVQLFTKSLGIYPVGSFIKLVSGEMGIVLQRNSKHLLAPKVLLLFNKNGIRLPLPRILDLWECQKQENGDQFKIKISLNPHMFNIKISDFLTHKI